MTSAPGREVGRGRAIACAIPLFPSGEDANPLNRRLPAEVITRRRRETKKTEEKPPDEVKVDLKTALSLKPEARLKWLSKAFKMAEEGRAGATELYDIMSSRKFATGVPSKMCRKLRVVVHENLEIFSDKQQRYLKSDDWALNASCGDRDGERDLERADADKDGEKDIDEKEDDRGSLVSGSSVFSPVLSKDSRPLIKDRLSGSINDRFSTMSSKTGTGAGAGGQPERGVKAKAALLGMPPDGGGWMEADDAAARQREQAIDRARRDAHRAKERAKRQEEVKEEPVVTEESKKRALENEVDDSLMLLERLAEQKQQAQESSRRSRSRSRSRRGSRRKRDRRRTSRSVSAASQSRSRRRSGRGKDKGKDKVDFNEALKRRMRERESELDSARIPVVDPGHAKRHLGTMGTR